MTPVKASSFGRRIGCARRYPGGRRYRSILRTVSRASPKRRAAAAHSIPPHTRCAAPPHRAPLDTSLLCSTKHPGNARWTTHAVWFSAASGRVTRRAVVYFCSAVLTTPESLAIL